MPNFNGDWFSWLTLPKLTDAGAMQRFSESFYSGLWAGLLSSLVTGVFLGIFIWRLTTTIAERQANKGNYSRLFYTLASSDGRTFYRKYTINDKQEAVRLMVHYVDIINSISLEGFDKQTREFESVLDKFRESYIRLIKNPSVSQFPKQGSDDITQSQEIKSYIDDVNLNFEQLYRILDRGIRPG
jgi:hypothetical protein